MIMKGERSSYTVLLLLETIRRRYKTKCHSHCPRMCYILENAWDTCPAIPSTVHRWLGHYALNTAPVIPAQPYQLSCTVLSWNYALERVPVIPVQP